MGRTSFKLPIVYFPTRICQWISRLPCPASFTITWHKVYCIHKCNKWITLRMHCLATKAIPLSIHHNRAYQVVSVLARLEMLHLTNLHFEVNQFKYSRILNLKYLVICEANIKLSNRELNRSQFYSLAQKSKSSNNKLQCKRISLTTLEAFTGNQWSGSIKCRMKLVQTKWARNKISNLCPCLHFEQQIWTTWMWPKTESIKSLMGDKLKKRWKEWGWISFREQIRQALLDL